MKLHKTLCLTGLLSAMVLSANADTYKLKDGRTLEGKLSFETDDSYVLLVEVRKGIRNEITVKKADVRYVKKAKKKDDSKAQFKKLQKLLPTADLLNESDYQKLLKRKVRPLLRKFPNSAHIAIAKQVETTLLTEQAKVAAGGVKFEGKWLTAEEVEANKYELEAAIAASEVSKLLKSRSYALAFAQLNKLQKEYKNTKQFHAVAKESLKALPRYKAKAQSIITNADKVKLKRDQSLQRLSSGDAIKFKELLELEEAKFQSGVNQAKASRSKWLPLNRYHPETAKTALLNIDKETVNLQSITALDVVDAGELYRNALVELNNKDIKAADVFIRQFVKLRPARIHSDHLKQLKKQIQNELKLLKKQEKAAAAERKRLERQAKLDKRKKKDAPAEEPKPAEKSE